MAGSLEYWAVDQEQLLSAIGASENGLSGQEARRRLSQFGPNRLVGRKRMGSVRLLDQFISPIILILVFAAFLSAFLHDVMDAFIILTIVIVSGLLGFWQERGATQAVARLLEVIRTTASVLRDAVAVEISPEEVVPGDVVLLTAGSSIPADGRLLESRDLFVDEAALTGETFPVEKATGPCAPETPLGRRTNCVFMGTHVVSGSGPRTSRSASVAASCWRRRGAGSRRWRAWREPSWWAGGNC
jgi:Mg2+-importing ATPase